MNGWFRLNANLLNDRSVQSLTGRQFKRAFVGAARGELTPLSPFIRRCTGRPPASIWLKVRRIVFERDDFTCRYCGKRGVRLECDHVMPLSRGGSSHPDNLVTACRPCNRAKRDRTPEEWKPRCA